MDQKTQVSRPRVWLITGTSSGFGMAIAQQALAAGDLLIATARDCKALEPLMASASDMITALELDVTDQDQIKHVVHDGLLWQGRIDVLVNNAGRGEVSAAEHTTDKELRDLFDLHVFGPASIVRAVLPHMRSQRSGTIVQMSSFGGQVAPPGFSAYCATKFAIEGYSEALAAEVAPLGIRVLIVEPGAFRTSFSGPALREGRWVDDYEDTVGQTRRMVKSIDGRQPGDPAVAAQRIYDAVTAERAPLRLALGDDAVSGIREHLTSVGAELDEWAHLSTGTGF